MSGPVLRLTESVDACEKGGFPQPMGLEENDSNIISPAPRLAESVEEREREGSHHGMNLVLHCGAFTSTSPVPPALIPYTTNIMSGPVDAPEKGGFPQPMDVEENDSNITGSAPRLAESIEERKREGSHQATDLVLCGNAFPPVRNWHCRMVWVNRLSFV